MQVVDLEYSDKLLIQIQEDSLVLDSLIYIIMSYLNLQILLVTYKVMTACKYATIFINSQVLHLSQFKIHYGMFPF